jgi:deoxycytidine triphosphate deaminase
MSLLRDQDLVASMEVKPPAVPYAAGVEMPADPYASDSPVQGSSIDLRIGHIYLPGKKKKDLGGVENPKSTHSLKTGHTAVVTTKEKLQLPDNIAGIGFPPSSVSFKGLLMTNPGHVDPGYEGVMRFTVINMGKDPYSLNRGERIVRLLLFKLDAPAHAGWRARHPEGSRDPNEEEISRLSEDFVDVESRAKEIAKQEGRKWSVGITVAASLIVGILQLFSSGHLFSRDDVTDLKKRQEMVEYDLKNRVEVERKLQDFENRLKDLERTSSGAPSGQKKGQGQGSTATNAPGKNP